MLNDAWFLQYTIRIIIYRFASNAAAQVKMRCQLSTALKLLHIQCLWSLGGATEKMCSPCHWKLMGSSPDDVTTIHGKDSRREKLAVLTGWEGGHTLPPLSVTMIKANHGCLWAHVCGRCDAAGWVHMVQESMCKSLTSLEGRCWLMVYVSSWKIVHVG